MRTLAKPLAITVDDARAIPWPDEQTHKHSRGRLAVIAGDALHTGAARLTARAGQRVGTGWVSLFGVRDACEIMAHHETSILICQRDSQRAISEHVADFDAVVIGPAFGLETAQRDDVFDLVGTYQNGLVLDADALRHLAHARSDAFALTKSRSIPAIMTPHSGEFSALFGQFDPDTKVKATLRAAEEAGCIIVHKGAVTVVATPAGELYVCDIPAPFLASAGTGDVLAGMIGGLWAQGMSGVAACKAALWLHSTMGKDIGPGLIAEDLILALPAALKVAASPH
jgi:ADP-dependent NAD(P)H-hydrate dehydratase / NAD(P)H-hydrate epimerase